MPQDPFAQYAVKPAPKDDPFAAYVVPPPAPSAAAQPKADPFASARATAGGAPASELWQRTKDNPVGAGAIIGSALLTGGASPLIAAGRAALGAAGGAGYGITADALRKGPSASAAEDVGTMGASAALAGGLVGGAGAAAKYARQAVVSGAKALADERPLLTQVRQKVAQKVLARVLDMTKQPVAGARVVKPSAGPSIEDEIAAAIDEIRGPQSVELPPAAGLPEGYTPRTSAPAPTSTAAPVPGARIVQPPTKPTVEQELASAIEQARAQPAPTRVSTPPQAELPPGYTPRTTVPKQAPPKPSPAADPPKRAYFLKSPEEIAASRSAAESFEPSGSITIDDLPTAWKAHTGQDLFPNTGAEAREITQAFREQVKASGMTVGQAIAAVSKNKNITTSMRTQIIRALNGGR